MQTLEPYLAEHPFLKGIETRHIQLLVGCAGNVRFDAGQYIFREGDEANEFYFIRHGKLALEIFRPHKGGIVVQTLQPGDVVGWSWLFPPHFRLFDCRAIELTRAIALDGTCLRNKCEEDYQLGYEMMRRFAHLMEEELLALRLQVLDIYGVPG
ncbi:MAG: cyclic nucleotide-binding domain-containing protein [Candidatus Zixiibacteriota bacterium]|nr:MAG: cyclic nucleotide-binding domain-containing protein [candidate division Zixibacteria bacterium]